MTDSKSPFVSTAGAVQDFDQTDYEFACDVEDRSRALATRTPTFDIREVLGAHVTPGGHPTDAFRFDHLVEWATAGEER